MKGIVKWFDTLPLILKIIFALPVLDGIFYGIYRIAKGRLLVGILWIVLGAVILWILDIISICLYRKPKYFV